jgi:bacterioferritin (cytochrome b1)
MKKDTIFEEAYLVAINSDETELTRWDIIKEKFSLENRETLDESTFAEYVKELLVIAVIDEQLAELNYLQSYNLSKTEGKSDFDPEFEQHESDERQHKYDLINRLRELDAEIIFVTIDQWIPLNSRGTEWKQDFSNNSFELIKNRLIEEEQAVEFYGLATEFLRGTSDTTTYTLFKKIKEDEEEHVKDLRDLAREYGAIKD